MQQRKIYVVGKDNNYANWMQGTIVDNMEDSDLVVFTGGEDVSPSTYRKPVGSHTFSSVHRDIKEVAEFEKAQRLNKKCIGICRGAQLLCALSKGNLVQHMSHPSQHVITTYDNEILKVTSSHHQMQYPFFLPEEDYKILGYCNLSDTYLDGNDQEMNTPKDCEIVYYSKTNCLAIQSHPEWQGTLHPTVLYLQQLLDKFMNDEQVFSKKRNILVEINENTIC